MNSADHFSLPPLSRQQAREIDVIAIEKLAVPGILLMENAGRSAAEQIARQIASTEWSARQSRMPASRESSSIAILCGKGNNAGDGYVIARHLELLGHAARLIQCSPPEELRGDALVQWKIAQASQIPTRLLTSSTADLESRRRILEQDLSQCGIILDCLLGTGSEGPPRQPFALAIEVANRQEAIRVAIDVPSGLDCDTGIPSEPCFRADLTCTFVATKIGFSNPQAKAVLGQVHVCSIGVPNQYLLRR